MTRDPLRSRTPALRLAAAALAALGALLAAPAAAQTPPPQTPPSPTGTPVDDGATLPAPGSVPAATSETARALWAQLLAATAGQAQGPIRAFDLAFDARVYSGEKQTNDLAARYLYLEPGFVRMVLESGRERMRGAKGDFLVDKSGVYPLRGRDYAEDRRELDETVAVARLFVGLTDPGRLRLVSLAVLPAPPPHLPERLGTVAAELDWLVLESPDFRVRTDGKAATLDRVELGLERGTHLPVLALVTDPAEPRSAVLARLEDYQPLDGWRVPWKVATWRVADGQALAGPAAAPRRGPLAFEEKPAVRLWLVEGKLRPTLAPADFEPPS